jgi:aminoglycoside 3-N-acetyltransferase
MAASADGITAAELASDLRALGVAEGAALMVHSSLSAIGQVAGGPDTVIRALLAAIGPRGTLVLPAFRDSVILEGLQSNSPEPALAEARAIPLYDPATTPTTMGAIPEAFRHWPGVIRSAHPFSSVCALGPAAAHIIAPHPLPWSSGPESPLARLTAMDAQILLLGVGFNRLTLLHHAENLVPNSRRKTRVVPTAQGIVLAHDVGDDLDTHFPPIGEGFMATGAARQGRIGAADSVLMTARPVMNFARQYLESVFGGL